MRTYDVWANESKFTVTADEIKFISEFRKQTTNEPLVFFQGDMLVAIFRNWDYVIDVTETVKNYL